MKFIKKVLNVHTSPGPADFGTYGIEISDSLDLLVVICTGQLSKTFWVKLSTVGEELGSVLLGQFSAKRVDSDDESSPICLKLQHKQEIDWSDRK